MYIRTQREKDARAHTQVSGSPELQARIQLVDADGQEIKRPICPFRVCTYVCVCGCSLARARARICTCAFFVKLILIKVLLIIFCGQSALHVHVSVGVNV